MSGDTVLLPPVQLDHILTAALLHPVQEPQGHKPSQLVTESLIESDDRIVVQVVVVVVAHSHRPHTGESIQLADVTMDFLYTYEDSISAETGDIIPDKLPLNWGGEPKVDQNNSSTVVRITFDGKTFLLTGDIVLVAQDALLENYSDAALKCDILQVAHHGLNPLDKLYAKVKPAISLYTQKKEAAPLLNALSNGVYESIIQHTEGGLDNIYFQGNCTVGISVNGDGSFKRDTESFRIVTEIWDGEDMFHIYQQNQ